MTVPYDTFEKKAGAASVVAAGELVPCDMSRLLVVDDEMRVREVFKMILADGFPEKTIETAANARFAAVKECYLAWIRMPGASSGVPMNSMPAFSRLKTSFSRTPARV